MPGGRSASRSQQDAETTRDWALNQGFYNLFLAIGAHRRRAAGRRPASPTTVAAGVGMVLLATGSMLGAAVVLLVTKPALLRGVLIQGVAPLLAIIASFGASVSEAPHDPGRESAPSRPASAVPPASGIVDGDNWVTRTRPPDTVFYAVSD